MAASRPQLCHLTVIYANWAIYFGGAIALLAAGRFALFVLWIVLAPAIQWAYVQLFPRLSDVLGYGPVDDRTPRSLGPAPVSVTLYTAAGCPFCPVLERRLRALEDSMGIGLSVIDVTLRPDIIKQKRLRSVPTVEVGGTLIPGNLTSEALVDVIRRQSRAA